MDLAIHFLVLTPKKIKKQIEKNWEKLRKIEKNWEKLRKCFLEKKQIATRGEDETMHHRLGTGVDYMIVLDFVPSPTLSCAQVCVIFFPKTEND